MRIKISISGFVCAAILFAVSNAAAATVAIEKAGDGWRLLRDGQPYFIKGAGGGGSRELLRDAGANSFRTWGAEHAAKDLDEARRLGMTVTLGIWLRHEGNGFSYGDAAALERQKQNALDAVRKHKDHPALLMWGVGNEMEQNNKHRVEMWKHVNDIAAEIKRLDPRHPVMTVVAEIPKATLEEFARHCPDVDILGINTYGGGASVAQRYAAANTGKPYILTEFGPHGPWESGKSPAGAPFEMTSTEKARHYDRVYRASVQGQPACLGSYAFTWGAKTEGTPTWFGILLPDGARLGAADALQACWGEKPPRNRAPEITGIELGGVDPAGPAVGGRLTAKAKASDPDGDRLSWQWALVPELSDYDNPGERGKTPPDVPDVIAEGQGTSAVTVRLSVPKAGNYRLYAYVRDGKGAAAVANVPIAVMGK